MNIYQFQGNKEYVLERLEGTREITIIIGNFDEICRELLNLLIRNKDKK